MSDGRKRSLGEGLESPTTSGARAPYRGSHLLPKFEETGRRKCHVRDLTERERERARPLVAGGIDEGWNVLEQNLGPAVNDLLFGKLR
jgi:hypothetical protein